MPLSISRISYLSLILSACSSDKMDTGDADHHEGYHDEDCNDGIDNDSDGLIDCDDDGCFTHCNDTGTTPDDTGNIDDTGETTDTGDTEDTGDTGIEQPLEETCDATFYTHDPSGLTDTFNGCADHLMLGETRLNANQEEALKGYQAQFSSLQPGLSKCGITIAQSGICGTGRYNRQGGGVTGNGTLLTALDWLALEHNTTPISVTCT